MTRAEFTKIAAAIRTYYPNVNMLMTPQEIELWFDMFQTIEYGKCYAAVKQWVATEDRPPRVSNLLERCRAIVAGDDLNEAEAWALTWNAICRSGDHAEEEFKKLPPVVQRAVGTAAQLRRWAMDEDFNESVESSNFKRTYRAMLEREKNEALIPENIRALTQGFTARLEG